MGLLDYYRQFAGMTDEEVTEQLREQAEEHRRRALARIEELDLSRTTWHELPHPDVVNAVTFATAGSSLTRLTMRAAAVCIAGKEASSAPRIPPKTVPLSCCGKKPFGTITNRKIFRPMVTSNTSSVMSGCRRMTLKLRS